MTADLTRKIEEILAIDTPSNYECWEDAEESILEELTETESEQYQESCSSMIEDWFAANEETEDQDDEA